MFCYPSSSQPDIHHLTPPAIANEWMCTICYDPLYVYHSRTFVLSPCNDVRYDRCQIQRATRKAGGRPLLWQRLFRRLVLFHWNGGIERVFSSPMVHGEGKQHGFFIKTTDFRGCHKSYSKCIMARESAWRWTVRAVLGCCLGLWRCIMTSKVCNEY